MLSLSFSSITKFFKNPFAISVIIFGFVAIAFPWQPDTYNIKKTAHDIAGSKSVYTYRDIDNDGISDKLRFINFRERGTSSVVVYRNNKILGQWNFKGTWRDNGPMFMVGDYDQNGVEEIFLFTHHQNSVLLHGLAPFSRDSMIVENRTIFDYGTRDLLPVDNITVQQGGFANLDDHPSRELYFSLTTGFNKEPRGVGVYNFEKDSLHYRSMGGVCLKNFHHIETRHRDFPLLTGDAWAYGNHPPDTTFTDMKGWLMVFNRDLEFLFEPISFDEHPMQLIVEPLKRNGETFLLVYHRYNGDREDIDPTLYVYDLEGNKIREKSFPDLTRPRNSGIVVRDDALFLVSGEGKVNELDHQLGIRKTRKIEDISHGIPLFSGDINGDDRNEFVFRGKGKSGLVVTNHRLKHPVPFSFEGDLRRPEFSIKKTRDGDRFLFVQSRGDITEFSYFLNPFYRYRYLLYAGLFAVIWLMVWAGKKLRAWCKYRKNYPREEMDELKVKSLRNVAEPHLTFNVLNALSAMLYNDEPEKANEMVIKYAKLLRNYLVHSGDLIVPLAEEMQNCEYYLEIERFRFDQRFDFNVEKDDKICKEISVPRMFVFNFVQNAVKHGVSQLQSGGRIDIKVVAHENNCHIKITDNGPGLKSANRQTANSTRKGTETINDLISYYENANGKKITYQINDLKDKKESGKDQGTAVIIDIPY